MQIIETEHLTKYYGKTPAVDWSFPVRSGGQRLRLHRPKRRGKIHHHENALGLVKPNSGSSAFWESP